MSRIPFKPTPELRTLVKTWAAVGVPQDDIATLIDCSPKTLRKHFRKELDLGMAEATAVVVRELLRLVQAGNTSAQIFWTKVQCQGWSRELATEVKRVGPDEPVRAAVVVILPDNHRSEDATAQAEGIWAEAVALKERDQSRKTRDAERYRRKSSPKPKTE
jgi:hypothetical protein